MPPETDPATPPAAPTQPFISPQTPPPEPASELTFTQDQINEMIGKAKGTAESAAQRKVSEALGMPVEDAAAILKAHNDQVEARKDDLTRAAEAAAEAQAQAAQATATANEAQLQSRLTVALFEAAEGEAPLRTERLNAALLMGVPYAMTLDGDDAVAKARAYIRSQSPEWFTPAPSGEPKPPATPLPPGRGPGAIQVPADDASSKAKQWAQRFAASQASSPVPSPKGQ